MGWTDLIERLKRATGLSDRQIASMEKRRAFRVPRRIGVIGVRANGDKIHLLGTNFGAQGVRVESPQRLRRHEILMLIPSRQPEDRPAGGSESESSAPHMRVVWTKRRKEEGSYEVGLVFILDTPHLRRAAAHFLLDDCRLGIRDPRENRKVPRVRAEMAGVAMTEDCHSFDVTIKDIAMGGALLVSPRSVPRNTHLDIKVYLPEAPTPLQCHGTVVRTAKVGKHTELGVAFTSVAADHKERLVSFLSQLMQTH